MTRGHYKIFLGMAAGVGKTYRMLQEGHAEADAGRDVVIGYLEPHDRPETTALAEGLEVVPRLRQQHGTLALRGVKFRAIAATALLRRNLLIYGLGGVILPFVGIKLIDLVVHNLLGA